jgi:succinyl-CoA synthetase beta subunit
MKIHEHQAKQILAEHGVPTPRGVVCTTADEVEAAARELGGGVCVVKAQVHAGGRGKGGGVKVTKSVEEARAAGEAILGMQLVTHQTGADGVLVRKVLVEEGSDIANEYYVGIAIDRAQGLPVLMASTEGGVEIEVVAAETPEKILKEAFRPGEGLQGFQARRLAFGLGFEGKQVRQAVKVLQALANVFVDYDCSLAEINPLVLTGLGDVVALDAKMSFDDSALYRHPDVEAMEDFAEEDAREVRAKQHDLAYIHLDGDIGCMVNGAGLAMSTMDVIQHHGGMPANFLDVGGGASLEKVTEAFRIILEDPRINAILVNIFGGIMKCDVIAEGVVTAAREVGLEVPLVVRLEGTNVERGRQILAESGIELIVANDMTDAAEKAVNAARGAA